VSTRWHRANPLASCPWPCGSHRRSPPPRSRCAPRDFRSGRARTRGHGACSSCWRTKRVGKAADHDRRNFHGARVGSTGPAIPTAGLRTLSTSAEDASRTAAELKPDAVLADVSWATMACVWVPGGSFVPTASLPEAGAGTRGDSVDHGLSAFRHLGSPYLGSPAPRRPPLMDVTSW
jgi:hypothetical protein